MSVALLGLDEALTRPRPVEAVHFTVALWGPGPRPVPLLQVFLVRFVSLYGRAAV